MAKLHRPDGLPERRYVVLVALLGAGAETYGLGDVVTGTLLGPHEADVLRLSAVAEVDYELAALFDDLHLAPEGREAWPRPRRRADELP